MYLKAFLLLLPIINLQAATTGLEDITFGPNENYMAAAVFAVLTKQLVQTMPQSDAQQWIMEHMSWQELLDLYQDLDISYEQALGIASKRDIDRVQRMRMKYE